MSTQSRIEIESHKEPAQLEREIEAKEREIEAKEGEIEAKDLEIDQLKAELDSKQELIRALRRDAEMSDRLKADAKRKDKEIEALRLEKSGLEGRVTQLEQNVAALSEAVEEESAEVSSTPAMPAMRTPSAKLME